MKPSPYTVRYTPDEIRAYRDAGLWSAETCRSAGAARRRTPRQGVRHRRNKSLTYRELLDSVRRLARPAASRLAGRRPGRRTAAELGGVHPDHRRAVATRRRHGADHADLPPRGSRLHAVQRRDTGGVHAFDVQEVSATSACTTKSERDHHELQIVVVGPTVTPRTVGSGENTSLATRGRRGASHRQRRATCPPAARTIRSSSSTPPEPHRGPRAASTRSTPTVRARAPCRAVRLHRERRPVRPIPDRPHHRTGDQRAAAPPRRGRHTPHGRMGTCPRHRGDPALRLHRRGDGHDVPAHDARGVSIPSATTCPAFDSGPARARRSPARSSTRAPDAAEREGAQPLRAQRKPGDHNMLGRTTSHPGAERPTAPRWLGIQVKIVDEEGKEVPREPRATSPTGGPRT